MNLKHSIAASAVIALTWVGGIMPAAAGLIATGTTYSYDLTLAAATSGLGINGVGNFGTVTLTQALDEVDVSVVLKAGYLFSNTSGPHQAFVYNLGTGFGNAAVAVTSFPNVFKPGSGSTFDQTPWGTFNKAIDYQSGVGGGLSAKITGPLTFTVKATGISLDSFINNGYLTPKNSTTSVGYIFSADIGNAASTNTGNVTTVANEAPHIGHVVPEPGTIALFSLGLLGAALAGRRRS